MSSPNAWGVTSNYRDVFDRRRRISSRIQRRVLEAMGIDPAATPAREVVHVARPGDPLPRGAVLLGEDGTDLGGPARLPRDLPVGYYTLVVQDVPRLLLVPPRRCVLPARGWGWAVQAYATRSEESWGIGDLGDLRALAAWAAEAGARFVAVSPLFAANPAPEPEPSPYFATTRRFLNPLALRIEEVPGAAHGEGATLRRLARAGRRLNADRRIDRGRVRALKMEALRQIWTHGGGRRLLRAREPAAFRAAAGSALRDWASFAALCEHFGPGWRRWPEDYRQARATAVRRFAADNADAVAFHEWLQWLADRQLAAAGERLALVGDLPVGIDPQGFDAWAWQDLVAARASVGAPPDRFNTAGQDWGLPPFVPHRLREARYRPFIEIVRAAMRHAGGLRIDHVLGLFRLWWIPRGDPPEHGAYVRYPADELLAVLAIESQRAGAFVIGEDLGTVPRGVRTRLARAGVLSTRLLYFERRAPTDWPRLALAGVTTHDLPTVAGSWTGADLADQAAAGLEPDRAGLDHLRSRLADATGLPRSAEPGTVILAAHRAVAASPSLLAMATLEDALRVERRPNLPGTNNAQRDNWSVALPLTVEQIAGDPFVVRVIESLRR